MHVRRELRHGRDLVIAFFAMGLATLLVGMYAPPRSPSLHTLLDSGIFVLTGVLAVQLWDVGWRESDRLAKLAAVSFCVTAALDTAHAIAGVVLDVGDAAAFRFVELWRPATWPPSAYVLPLGLALAFHFARRAEAGIALLASLLAALGILSIALFAGLPRYTAPVAGVTRPTLLLVPLLWVAVGATYWRCRAQSPVALALAAFAALSVVSNCFILFSQSPGDLAALVSHIGKFFALLYLLLSLTQMGTVDTARRMRAEVELRGANAGLEQGLRERNAELETAVGELRSEASNRQRAEERTQAQLERLRLLHQITHAAGEHQDLTSIFQVVVTRLEERMPVDFAAICRYEPVEKRLTLARLGAQATLLAPKLGWHENAVLDVGADMIRRCLHGSLVHEPDTAAHESALPRAFGDIGLRSLVAAPITFEHQGSVSGVLLVARAAPRAFSGGEREFLGQLCSQVALAAEQTHLHAALQHAYDDIRNTQQSTLQQERLRALAQMASGIANDVNNAMSPLSIYLESLLEREPGLSERAREQLEIMRRSIGDVARTIARLAEFYRRRDAGVELLPVNVNVILEQVPELTRARWADAARAPDRAISVRVEKAPDSPSVLAIESELREALANLVLNAVDALPDGGTITLRARPVAPPAPQAAAQIAIEVVDDGVGMDEETRRHCLEPFFSTKGDRRSGLGLAMVYGIAERNAATLEIESAPERGTTVRLLFAVVRDISATSTTVRGMRAARKVRVLVIDDDPMLLRSLRDALEFDGHEVRVADSGQAGIDAFRASVEAGAPFPLVITDLGMPAIDGRQVAAAIKHAHSGTRVVMLTGWGRGASEFDGLPAGVDRVLGKPPNMWQLRDALADLGGS